MTDLHTPPHSTEAEQSLIGGLLFDNRAWDRVADIVCDSDFYRDDHRRIFRHIAVLMERGQAADVVTVFESLEKSGESSQVGGLAYLAEIANGTFSAANAVRYAEIIRERSKLRGLLCAAQDLAVACAAPGTEYAEAIAQRAEAAMCAVLDDRTGEPRALQAVFAEALEYLDETDDASAVSRGLRLGCDGFDRLTGGLEPGQLVVVAARPSVGKTAFACNAADHVARSGGAVLFCTLEMTAREIGMRMLACRTGVPVSTMRRNGAGGDHWHKLTDQLGRAGAQRLFVDDKAAVPVSYIRAKARRLKRQVGLDLIVIDYLQLMRGEGSNRTQEIGSVSRGLKALAKELQVPIIALAQLNRGVESRQDKRPLMSDLRDSGEVEQDADIIAMLHREEIYNNTPEWSGVAELLVRKNRNGPTGDVLLEYLPELMRFSEFRGKSPRSGHAFPAGRSSGFTYPASEKQVRAAG